jgi:RNA polymerase-binding transcription factor DksA
MSKWDHYEELLRERMAELTAKLQEVEETLDAPHSKDAEDLAQELEDTEVLEGLGKAGLQEITAIEAALDRIRQGSYGECVKCGEEIAPARLEAVPYAALCVKCA